MNSKEGTKFARSKAFVAGSTVAALAGLSLILSAFQSDYSFGKDEHLVLRPSAWSWLGDLHFGLAEGISFGEFEVPKHKTFEIPHLVKAPKNKAPSKVALRPKAKLIVRAKARVIKSDAVVLSQASSVMVSERDLSRNYSHSEQDLPTQKGQSATADELEQMQAIHKKILNGFKLSLRSPVGLSTQVAQIEPADLTFFTVVNTQPEPAISIALKKVQPRNVLQRTKKTLNASKAVATVKQRPVVTLNPEASLEDRVKTLVAAFDKEEQPTRSGNVNIQIRKPAQAVGSTDRITIQAAAPVDTQEKYPNPAYQNKESDHRGNTPESVSTDRTLASNINDQTKSGYSTPHTQADARTSLGESTNTQTNAGGNETDSQEFSGFVTGPKIAFAGGYSQVPSDYPNVNMHFFDQGGSPGNNLVGKDKQADQNSVLPDEARSTRTHGLLADTSEIANSSDGAKENKPTETPAGFVELFRWNDVITDAASSMMSREGSSSDGVLGWQMAQSSNHWTTLYWGVAGSSPRTGIPLIHANTAAILAKQNSITLQGDTGVIFGRIGKGWSVEVSGRGERPLYFSETGQNVASSDNLSDRIFLIFNVSPGTHEIVARREGASAGVLASVVGSVATYIDLGSIKNETIAGTVYDAAATKRTKVGGIQVRVIGQNAAITATDAQGRFIIPSAYMVLGYPYFLETDGTSGFAHRYKFSSGRYLQLKLFRFSNESLHEWLDQLSGGVSGSSGIVVAAFPMMAQEKAKEGLYPSYLPLTSDLNLVPEVYTLSAEGQLQVQTPLKEGITRFIGVQLSEGPGIVQIYDKSRHLLWGEMTYIQPKIVNVIGEY